MKTNNRFRILTIMLLLLFISSCNKLGFLFSPSVNAAAGVVNSLEQVSWSWEAIPGAVSYEVKFSEEGGWIDVGTALEATLPAELYAGDGEYQLFVRAKNGDGGYSSERSATILVDATAPAVPEIVESTLKTNNRRPVWRWSEVAGADYYAYGFKADGSDRVVVKGRILEHSPQEPLNGGTYTLYVWAGDKAGNWSAASKGATTIIDISGFIPPTVYCGTAGKDMLDGDTVLYRLVNSARPNWKWEISLNDTERPYLDKFRYQLNGQRDNKWFYVDKAVKDFIPDVDLIDGLHTLYVQAGELVSSGSLNWSDSARFSIKINTGKPQKALVDGIAATASIPSWSWDLYPEALELQFAIVQDDFGNVNPADYETRLATMAWVGEDRDNDGSVSPSEKIWTASKRSYQPAGQLPPGIWSLVIRVRNELGTWSDPAWFATEVVMISSDSPTVTAQSVSPGNDSTPTWNWSIAGDVDAFRYQLNSTTGSWTQVTASTTSYTPSAPLSHGTHTLHVQSLAVGGNPALESDWSTPGDAAIILDLQPPAVPVVSGVKLTGNRRPTWSWNIPATSVKSRFRVSHAVPDGSGGFTYEEGFWVEKDMTFVQYSPSKDLPVDEANDENNYYQFEIQVCDAVGNWSQSGAKVTQISTKVPASPQVSGDSRTASVRPTWNWTTTITPTATYVKLNDQSGDPTTWDVPAVEGTWTPATDLADGSHTLYVVIADKDGLLSGAGFHMITVDTTGPAAPVVDGPALTGQKRPTWTWSAPEGAAGYRHQLNAQSAAGWTEEALSVQTFMPTADLADGNHTLYVQAKDDLGNWSTVGSAVVEVSSAAGAPPVVLGPDLTKNSTPTWTWTATSAVMYRYSLGSASGPWTNTASTSYTSVISLSGAQTLYVQAKNAAGLWSSSGSHTIVVDQTPPTKPVVDSFSPNSGDTTPLWWWADIADAASYRCRIGTGNWVDLTKDQLNYTPAAPLAPGSYTLFVTALDALGNESEAGTYTVTVDPAIYTDYGKPSEVTLLSVTKGTFSNSVRLEWQPLMGVDGYEIVYASQTEFDNNPVKENMTWTALTLNAAKQGVTAADGNPFYYHDQGLTGESLFFKVRAFNDDNGTMKIGDYSLFRIPEEFELSRGRILTVPETPSARRSATGMIYDWADVEGAEGYVLMRSVNSAAEPTPAALEADPANWSYLSTGSWVQDNGTTDFNAMDALAVSQYADDSGFESFKFFMNKVIAYNPLVRDNAQYQAEGCLSGNYYQTEPLYIYAARIPETVTNWLSASNNDTSIPGKVNVSINVPAAMQASINNYEINLKRTFRYGDGYQGHNATTQDTSSHCNITNPDPRAVPWEKTILVETVSGATTQVIDTQFDRNAAGEKLYAVRNLNMKQLSAYGTDGYAWYERTLAQMNAAGENYERTDANDEFEWHYLIWDWVFRKYMLHPGNPRHSTTPAGKDMYWRVNIEEATRCDYSFSVGMANKQRYPDEAVSIDKAYGWAAMTAREFTGLSCLIRDITFHYFGTSFADEVVDAQNNQPSQADITVNGREEGQAKAYNASGGLSGLKCSFAVVKDTSKVGLGFSDFPGIFIDFGWNMSVGISTQGKPMRAMSDVQFRIFTPKAQGHINITGDLLAGTYYHGVFNNNGGAKVVTTVQVPGAAAPYITDVNVGHTYPGEYMGGAWQRAYSSSAAHYRDRFTSINWSYFSSGYIYPNITDNPNTANLWK